MVLSEDNVVKMGIFRVVMRKSMTVLTTIKVSTKFLTMKVMQ